MSKNLKISWACVMGQLLFTLPLVKSYLIISNYICSAESILITFLVSISFFISMFVAIFETINEKSAGKRCKTISRVFPLVGKWVSWACLITVIVLAIKINVSFLFFS